MGLNRLLPFHRREDLRDAKYALEGIDSDAQYSWDQLMSHVDELHKAAVAKIEALKGALTGAARAWRQTARGGVDKDLWRYVVVVPEAEALPGAAAMAGRLQRLPNNDAYTVTRHVHQGALPLRAAELPVRHELDEQRRPRGHEVGRGHAVAAEHLWSMRVRLSASVTSEDLPLERKSASLYAHSASCSMPPRLNARPAL